jgi:hypothetical protein
MRRTVARVSLSVSNPTPMLPAAARVTCGRNRTCLPSREFFSRSPAESIERGCARRKSERDPVAQLMRAQSVRVRHSVSEPSHGGLITESRCSCPHCHGASPHDTVLAELRRDVVRSHCQSAARGMRNTTREYQQQADRHETCHSGRLSCGRAASLFRLRQSKVHRDGRRREASRDVFGLLAVAAYFWTRSASEAKRSLQSVERGLHLHG